MIKKHPTFSYTDCVSCRICIEVCPVSALTLTRRGKQGKYKNLFPELTNGCIGCGLCAKECPMDVIVMSEEG